MANMTKPVKKTSKKLYDQLCTEIDRIFDLYGKPTDNCIVLGVYYRNTTSSWKRGRSHICEDSLALGKAGVFRYFSQYYDWDYEYNPYVRPVMHDVSAFTVIGERKHDSLDEDIYASARGFSVGPAAKDSVMPKDVDKIPCGSQIEKLRDYYDDAKKLVDMIKPLMHSVCGPAKFYCDDSTNCYWRNYIVVGRDYKFRSFTMRYDAMMSNRDHSFDCLVVDSTLANCGHAKQNFAPTKDYGPTENIPVRKPVPYIKWKGWKKHIRRVCDWSRRGCNIGVANMDVVPFSKMKLKDLPICMITDIFLQNYDRGSDQYILNFFYYDPANKDEDIYALCQNSVYKYEYSRVFHQIGFNWYTLCCLHGDTDNEKKNSTKVVETYIGDMTPIEFIQFIRHTIWGDNMEYTGKRDLLYYGLAKKLARPSYKNFSHYENGKMWRCANAKCKPWYLSVEQTDEAKKILHIER